MGMINISLHIYLGHKLDAFMSAVQKRSNDESWYNKIPMTIQRPMQRFVDTFSRKLFLIYLRQEK